MKAFYFMALFLGVSIMSFGQHSIEGVICMPDSVAFSGKSHIAVYELGTENGVFTDYYGQFQIELSTDSATLVIRYGGQVDICYPVEGQSQLNIVIPQFEKVIITVEATANPNSRDNWTVCRGFGSPIGSALATIPKGIHLEKP